MGTYEQYNHASKMIIQREGFISAAQSLGGSFYTLSVYQGVCVQLGINIVN